MTTMTKTVELPVLRGRALRFVLTDEIHEHGTRTVEQLVATLHSYGFDVGGRASKVISDALRWEVRRGRVKRLGRGCYAKGEVPRTTMRRIRIFAAACVTWIRAHLTRPREKAFVPPPPSGLSLRHEPIGAGRGSLR